MCEQEGVEMGHQIENVIHDPVKIHTLCKVFKKYDIHYNDCDCGPFEVVLKAKEANLGKLMISTDII